MKFIDIYNETVTRTPEDYVRSRMAAHSADPVRYPRLNLDKLVEDYETIKDQYSGRLAVTRMHADENHSLLDVLNMHHWGKRYKVNSKLRIKFKSV